VGFAVPNYLIQEVVRNDVPWRNDVVAEPIAMESGIAHPPTAPGLGIEINENEAAKHPFAPEVTMPYFHRDGSVADW
jgi:galactonate dehydratase